MIRIDWLLSVSLRVQIEADSCCLSNVDTLDNSAVCSSSPSLLHSIFFFLLLFFPPRLHLYFIVFSSSFLPKFLSFPFPLPRFLFSCSFLLFSFLHLFSSTTLDWCSSFPLLLASFPSPSISAAPCTFLNCFSFLFVSFLSLSYSSLPLLSMAFFFISSSSHLLSPPLILFPHTSIVSLHFPTLIFHLFFSSFFSFHLSSFPLLISSPLPSFFPPAPRLVSLPFIFFLSVFLSPDLLVSYFPFIILLFPSLLPRLWLLIISFSSFLPSSF